MTLVLVFQNQKCLCLFLKSEMSSFLNLCCTSGPQSSRVLIADELFLVQTGKTEWANNKTVAPPFLIYRHFVRRETKIICQIFSSTRLVVAVRMHWLWNCRPISALTLILYFIFVPEETKRKFFIKNRPVLALHGTIFEHLASPESVMPSYPLILGSFIGASLPHALSMYYNLSVERPQLVRFLSSFCTFEELKLSEADKERPCHWMVNVLLIG